MVKIGYKPGLKYDQILRLLLALHRLELSEFKRLREGVPICTLFFKSTMVHASATFKIVNFCKLAACLLLFFVMFLFLLIMCCQFSDPQKNLRIRFWLFVEKALDPKCGFVHHLFLTMSAVIIPPSK